LIWLLENEKRLVRERREKNKEERKMGKGDRVEREREIGKEEKIKNWKKKNTIILGASSVDRNGWKGHMEHS
jgi:hypothetical protein